MRAIFINAVDQKVEEIQIENELHAFYERIGCDMIQCLDVGANHVLVAGFSLSFSPVLKVSPKDKLRSKWQFFKSGAEPEIDLISPYVM